jgi:hypothetical protein
MSVRAATAPHLAAAAANLAPPPLLLARKQTLEPRAASGRPRRCVAGPVTRG